MPREYAKAWFTMWTDEDFCNQPTFDKLLYNVLLAQPATVLNYAGVQTINFKRLRKAMRDGEQLPTELSVKAALRRMEKRRYVYTDDDTGETLIRSFIRRDEVSKQPNVMLSALRAAAVVESPKLCAVLLDELKNRVELPEIKGGKNPQAAERLRANLAQAHRLAVAHLEVLSEGFREGLPEPFAEDFPEGISEPFTRPGETEPFGEPFSEGIGEGSVEVVVGVEVEKSPSVGGCVGERDPKTADTPTPRPTDGPPPPFCPKHMPHGTDDPCRPCGRYRERRDTWEATAPQRANAARAAFWAEVRDCTECDERGFIEGPNDTAVRCPNHEWTRDA